MKMLTMHTVLKSALSISSDEVSRIPMGHTYIGPGVLYLLVQVKKKLQKLLLENFGVPSEIIFDT